MARLVIVAAPALLPFHHLPSICSPTRPGLSLWQVPPLINSPNSLPSHLYTQPSVIPTFKARLVIVAGPASSVSPHFFLSITPIFLFLWLPFPQAHDTACYYCKSHPSTCLPPHPPLSYLFPPYPSFGPAWHCGRSRQIPPLPLPAALPFWIPIFYLVFTLARLVIVAGPASSVPTAYHFTSFYHSHLLLPLKSPACHCGRSRLICFFYPTHLSVSLFSLSLSPFSCRPARAGRHGRSKVILLTLCHAESTSDSVGHVQAPHDEAASTGESGCASFSR